MKKRGEEFWAQVRRAYENGEGGYETLAERFGVCRQAVDKLGQAEGEPDVKTIRELAALMKELNQLMKISGESESGETTVQVQWGEEAEPWSE